MARRLGSVRPDGLVLPGPVALGPPRTGSDGRRSPGPTARGLSGGPRLFPSSLDGASASCRPGWTAERSPSKVAVARGRSAPGVAEAIRPAEAEVEVGQEEASQPEASTVESEPLPAGGAPTLGTEERREEEEVTEGRGGRGGAVGAGVSGTEPPEP